MIGFAIQFVIVVVCIVIIGLVIQWALSKFGIPVDPTLKVILGLIIFVIVLIWFLNSFGYMSGIQWNPRR